MGHTLGDATIVAALVAGFVACWYFRHAERRRRLEAVHQERLVAMEKGIPLPEFPFDPPRVPQPPDPRGVLLHGIAWVSLGFGGMCALWLGPWPHVRALWPLPLPLALLGVGLMLYYALAGDRAR